MNQFNYYKAYRSPFGPTEFRRKVREIQNDQTFLGFSILKGRAENDSMKINRRIMPLWTVPSIKGKYGKFEAGVIANVAAKPSFVFYFMGTAFFAMALLAIASPSTTINGESADFLERLLFGLFFIAFGWGILAVLHFIHVFFVLNMVEDQLKLKSLSFSCSSCDEEVRLTVEEMADAKYVCPACRETVEIDWSKRNVRKI